MPHFPISLYPCLPPPALQNSFSCSCLFILSCDPLNLTRTICVTIDRAQQRMHTWGQGLPCSLNLLTANSSAVTGRAPWAPPLFMTELSLHGCSAGNPSCELMVAMIVFSLEDGIHSPSWGFFYMIQDNLELTVPTGFRPMAFLCPCLPSSGIAGTHPMPQQCWHSEQKSPS